MTSLCTDSPRSRFSTLAGSGGVPAASARGATSALPALLVPVAGRMVEMGVPGVPVSQDLLPSDAQIGCERRLGSSGSARRLPNAGFSSCVVASLGLADGCDSSIDFRADCTSRLRSSASFPFLNLSSNSLLFSSFAMVSMHSYKRLSTCLDENI